MSTTGIQGESRVEDGVGVVVVSSVYPTDPEDLWAAITSVERLRRWFGDLTRADGDAASFQAALTTGWSGTLTVTHCDPPARLIAELRDATTMTTVTATLAPTDDGTRLTIEERGLEPVGLLDYVAGWHAQLEVFGSTDDTAWHPRWVRLREHYGATESR